MESVFTDQKEEPTEIQLKKALGNSFAFWQILNDFTHKSYPGALEKWNYSGKKHGWSFRIYDKKRVIIYLLPRDGFFKAALVFGQKATTEILESDMSDHIKNELNAAKVYAEGRGIRIEVRNEAVLEDIKKLVIIKIAN